MQGVPMHFLCRASPSTFQLKRSRGGISNSHVISVQFHIVVESECETVQLKVTLGRSLTIKLNFKKTEPLLTPLCFSNVNIGFEEG